MTVFSHSISNMRFIFLLAVPLVVTFFYYDHFIFSTIKEYNCNFSSSNAFFLLYLFSKFLFLSLDFVFINDKILILSCSNSYILKHIWNSKCSLPTSIWYTRSKHGNTVWERDICLRVFESWKMILFSLVSALHSLLLELLSRHIVVSHPNMWLWTFKKIEGRVRRGT